MGVISGLFKSRDKPTDRTAGGSYSFFLGGTTSGKYVTERSAMQMTAVYSSTEKSVKDHKLENEPTGKEEPSNGDD